MRRRVLLPTVAVLALGLAGPAAAGNRVPSKVTLRLGPEVGLFKGSVKSDAGRCTRNREVLIKREQPGADALIGSDHTNSNGRYRLQSSEMSGAWYARIKRKQSGSVLCGGDRSPTRSAG